MSTIDLALDWTPNTNHTGFYVAQSEDYYADREVDVAIHSPADNEYETTPAKQVATGEATVAIAPSESAISYHTHPDYDSLTAIAAVCQKDKSAIVTLKKAGSTVPPTSMATSMAPTTPASRIISSVNWSETTAVTVISRLPHLQNSVSGTRCWMVRPTQRGCSCHGKG